MQYEQIAKSITKKNGVYVWTGDVSEYYKARRILWRNWNQDTADKHRQERALHNMNSDEMCIDRRWLTDDPTQWQVMREKGKRLSKERG